MAENYKVNEHSQCPSCTKTPSQNESVQCIMCKGMIHAVCENCDNDHKLGSQTLIKCFLAPSTKRNFLFFCDVCLTNFERSLVETQEERIANLQRNFLGMETKLNSIIDMLGKEKETAVPEQEEKISKPVNIWADVERMVNVKAPEPTSVLVVKSVADEVKRQENQKAVADAVMQNDVSVVESYQNKSGDLMVVCESVDSRNQLKDIVTNSGNIIVNAPREMRHSVTIVGLPTQYEKEEVIEILVKQNRFIRDFAQNNKIDDHIRVHIIKPLKNKETCFQAFCDVSTILREGFHHYNNKLTLGLTTCKIYDRYNIKRCYNCQKFGHYAKDCPTNGVPVCGKCSEEGHNTRDCQKNENKCINCTRDKNTDPHHTTSSQMCPALIKEQDLMKKKLDNARLNLRRQGARPQS